MSVNFDELKNITKRLDDLFHQSVLDLKTDDRLIFRSCMTDLRFLIKKLEAEHNDYCNYRHEASQRNYGSELWYDERI